MNTELIPADMLGGTTNSHGFYLSLSVTVSLPLSPHLSLSLSVCLSLSLSSLNSMHCSSGQYYSCGLARTVKLDALILRIDKIKFLIGFCYPRPRMKAFGWQCPAQQRRACQGRGLRLRPRARAPRRLHPAIPKRAQRSKAILPQRLLALTWSSVWKRTSVCQRLYIHS